MNRELVNEQKNIIKEFRDLEAELKKHEIKRDGDILMTKDTYNRWIDENFDRQETEREKSWKQELPRDRASYYYEIDKKWQNDLAKHIRVIERECENSIEETKEKMTGNDKRYAKLAEDLKKEFANGGVDTYEACRKLRMEESERRRQEAEINKKLQKELKAEKERGL